MGADFGADLDAALNRGLERVRSAAEAAKARLGEPRDRPAAAPPPEPAPPERRPAQSAAAVSFDLDEPADLDGPLRFPGEPIDPLAERHLDAEGIPLPEENAPPNG